ncbi:DUF7410 domain-containing protein [Halomarina rubra]|uniref:C2H2-type zinc finger protein n=1 Tax=Halomarina rubra TaxID=2071873 RepID=A0ABD6AR40_9EURY|nr:C2H2-type zinc finger protein [Halomarina rubra]
MRGEEVETRAAPETTDDVFACRFCGRPFARAEYRALHYGLDHEASLDDDQRAAYDAALDEEEAELRKFRLKAALALVLVYFGFLLLWAVVNLLL